MSISITTTYAGESAGKYISASILTASTIANGGMDVRANVKYKEVISRLEVDSLVKDASCDFTSAETLTKTERILEPKELQVNVEVCKSTFRSDWDAVSMGYSAFDTLPKSFQDYLIGFIADKVSAKTETSIWSGATGNSGEFDGILTQVTVDADLPAGQEVTGTTITASNVVVELAKIVDAIPSNMDGRDDLKIYVPKAVYKSYIRAQATLGHLDRFNNQDMGEVMFDGIPLFVAYGMTANTCICTYSDNLKFGTGLLSDHNEVKVLDMADLDGSDNVRVIMRFTAGVNYGIVEDIVTYGVVNSAN